jgi:hypothetical protein
VAEFAQSFVSGSSRFADVHEEVFANRFYPVEDGLTGDFPEFVFVCGERDPRICRGIREPQSGHYSSNQSNNKKKEENPNSV